MFKLYFLTVIAALGSCTCYRAFGPVEQKQAAVSVTATCVVDGLVRRYRGSGVMVRPDMLLTAFHIIDHCPSPVIVVALGDKGVTRTSFANVHRVDASADVVSLKLMDSFSDVLPAAIGRRPVLSDHVCFYPKIPSDIRTCGEVLELYSDRKSGDFYIQAFTWPGNSGAGVWSDRGALIGITVKFAFSDLHRFKDDDVEFGNVRFPRGGLATSLWKRQWLIGE